MKTCVRERSVRHWLLIGLIAAFTATGCGDDATTRIDPKGGRSDDRSSDPDPIPGTGMMTPDPDRDDDDDATREEEPSRARDASRVPAADAAQPNVEAARDAGNRGDAGSEKLGDAGALRDAGDGISGGAGPTNSASVCSGGKVGMDSERSTTRNLANARNLAITVYEVKPPNRIVSFKTTMVVPKTPTQRSTLFIWPGLQHRGGADPARIGNGVLQPVLTWGPSCSRTASNSRYENWMIAAMYVNLGGAAGPSGCASGEGLQAEVGARLFIDMSLNGTAWSQSITNLADKKKVDFTFDLKGQDQNWAIWDIETPGAARPAEDTIFEDSVITAAQPLTSCEPTYAAEVDYFSAPVLSPDGLHCCIDKIILKQQRN